MMAVFVQPGTVRLPSFHARRAPVVAHSAAAGHLPQRRTSLQKHEGLRNAKVCLLITRYRPVLRSGCAWPWTLTCPSQCASLIIAVLH